MDRKTLEYMEERAKKARAIVMKIDNLTEASQNLIHTFTIGVETRNRVEVLETRREGRYSRLHSAIVNSIHQLIADEIALLEQELAEL